MKICCFDDFRLGLVDSVIVPVFYVIPVMMLLRGYKLTRTQHEKIQLELAEVRSASGERGVA